MKPHLPLFMRRDAMRLGWPGAIGMGVLALCLGLYFSLVQPARERADTARRSVGSMQQRLAAGAASGQDKLRPLDEQLAAFYASFPPEQDVADSVGKIAVLAREHGLALQQAEYKAERDRAGKLTRLRMSLPLKGSYPTIRQFLSSLRAGLPVVSLEQVHFERQKVGDALVDAKIGLVIYLGTSS